MIRFLRRQQFLASLTLVFVIGFCFSAWFEPFANARTLRNVIVATVLFVMALPLETKSIAQAISKPWPAILASLVNMALLPLMAWGMTRILVGDMRTGLLVTAAVPCTLASGVVWTRRAGGDDTVAVLVTAITNLSCFLVTPFWLLVTTGSQMSPELQEKLTRMPFRLALLVVLPMALAQLARLHLGMGKWATKNKPMLSAFAQLGILSMVLVGSTQCGLKLAGTSWSSLSGFPLMCLIAVALHLIVFWIGVQSGKFLGFERPQWIAIGIAGSQKTLMIGLDIAIHCFGGLAILPMVTYHFIQLMADTVIADRLRSGNE